jgi:predicted glycoside hydrolase/deacetylase ChbG (UPF0249 family)
MKNIILCADDYGQNIAISQAIITLLHNKRLSATSCMVNTASWTRSALHLLPYINQVDIGLHFNLTEGAALSTGKQLDSLSTVIAKSHLHSLSKKWLSAELNAQIDYFIQEMGRLPDFIDGHQHIQQMPVIRDCILEIYHQRFKSTGTYLRCSYRAGHFSERADPGFIKQMLVNVLGGRAYKKLLSANQVPHNQSFLGFYAFDTPSYREIFLKFLQRAPTGTLLMCHPGGIGEEHDPIAQTRGSEFYYLNSDKFLSDCAENNIGLKRFRG